MQLSDLLHTVPDSVLICNKSDSDGNIKAVYSNQKMNNFFGCDLKNFHKTKDIHKYRHGTKDEPLLRKVFSRNTTNSP